MNESRRPSKKAAPPWLLAETLAAAAAEAVDDYDARGVVVAVDDYDAGIAAAVVVVVDDDGNYDELKAADVDEL